MKRATVVIGANYGDEGKGHMVDYFAAQTTSPTIVVRFNGGAQAGHTVLTPDGQRHVFSHFGSGSFSGAATYFAKHFVCNPILFWHEAQKLADLGLNPMVAIDPRCFITTPYDMLINQAIENSRGDKRHGSVGLGFGETIERNSYPGFTLWYDDIEKDGLPEKLKVIRDRWMPSRFAQLRVRPIEKDDSRLGDEFLLKFVDACLAFRQHTMPAGVEFLEGKSVIFEGAQGLALDMSSNNFPHVTRSNTGLTNVLPLARVLSLDLDVVYVTRSYLTKHGAGPLPGEYVPDPPIVDETNTNHPYQGPLRFAPLDVGAMQARVDADHALAPAAPWSFAVTCIDQRAPGRDLEKLASLRSSGPRREDVQS